MAHQPPFTNEQTNQEASGNSASSACAQDGANDVLHAGGWISCAGHTLATIALDPHYPLPYVQAWNLDIQKTLPWGIVVNIGYNGTRGNRLDTVLAPRAIPSSPANRPPVCNGSLGCYPLNFTYDETASFSKFNAGTVRVNKRLVEGIALGANYQYSHSIDDAGAVGGVGGVGVQNWQNLPRRKGNSSFDVRHTGERNLSLRAAVRQGQVLGDDRRGFAHAGGIFGFRHFKFATGTPLTPSYQAVSDQRGVRHGEDVMRPDLSGVSVTPGADR